IAISDPTTFLKSTFQAYASALPLSPSTGLLQDHNAPVSAFMRRQVLPRLLADLHDKEPRTRRASHVMYAWRLRSHLSTASQAANFAPGPVLYGSSSGGEAGAGKRLERLLELSNCEDVIVVVFRWYGGVKLGPERWKCISSVAKEALERGKFLS
ncbi:hypothetical protein BD414DRAFT_372712, partial [Trametes punicea]